MGRAAVGWAVVQINPRIFGAIIIERKSLLTRFPPGGKLSNAEVGVRNAEWGAGLAERGVCSRGRVLRGFGGSWRGDFRWDWEGWKEEEMTQGVEGEEDAREEFESGEDGSFEVR